MASFNDAIQLYLGERILTYYISPENPEAYFWFDGEMGKTYTFTTFSDYDLVGDLYDSSFTRIMNNDDGGYNQNPKLEFTATSSQKIYFKIRAYSSPPYELMNFDVTFVEGSWSPPEEEPTWERVTIPCTAIPIYGYGRLPTRG